MASKENILLVKNMVCHRCVLAVENILNSLDIVYSKVTLGEIGLEKPLSNTAIKSLEAELKKIGFELIETRVNAIIEKIKKLVLEYLGSLSSGKKIKLSSYITQQIPNDYSYLSDLFSSIEGITIEQYFIHQRIEKVKELLVYDQLSLTEISYQTGFSSVHHFPRSSGK